MKFLNRWPNMSPLHFFSGFTINAAYNSKSAPNIFCGGLLLIGTTQTLCNTELPKRLKYGSWFLTIIGYISFVMQQFEIIWTGFIRNYSYQFRFAFVSCLIMIILACISIENRTSRQQTQRVLQRSIVVITVITLLLILTKDFITLQSTILYYVVLLIYVFMVWHYDTKKWVRKLILCFLCIELTANARCISFSAASNCSLPSSSC